MMERIWNKMMPITDSFCCGNTSYLLHHIEAFLTSYWYRQNLKIISFEKKNRMRNGTKQADSTCRELPTT